MLGPYSESQDYPRGLTGVPTLATFSILSFARSCAVPFAALQQHRWGALLCVPTVWLVNQCVGFAGLHYPLNLPTLGWGIALGAVAPPATGVASAYHAARPACAVL